MVFFVYFVTATSVRLVLTGRPIIGPVISIPLSYPEKVQRHMKKAVLRGRKMKVVSILKATTIHYENIEKKLEIVFLCLTFDQ